MVSAIYLECQICLNLLKSFNIMLIDRNDFPLKNSFLVHPFKMYCTSS